MTQSIARLLLGLLLLAGVVFALHRHGKQIPTHTFHAAPFIAGSVLEVGLIWLAGGWG